MTTQMIETNQARWNRVLETAETLVPYKRDHGSASWQKARNKAWVAACRIEALKAAGRHVEAAAVLLAAFDHRGQVIQ